MRRLGQRRLQIETPLMITLETSAGFDLIESARIGALVALAMVDLVLAGFDSKYAFDEWRPITHIQLADSVGNPAVVQDPSWVPLIVTPPFPDYVAQHCVLEGSFARVMKHFVHLHNVTNTSPGFASSSSALLSAPGDMGPPSHIPPITETFKNWRTLEQSIVDARVYGGVHLRDSDEIGLAMGKQLGHYVLNHALEPLDGPEDCDHDEDFDDL